MGLKLIAGVSADNYIGKDGGLAVYNSEDMKLFKNLTIGEGNNAVVMGRKTYESLPKKDLPERGIIVITSNPESVKDDIEKHVFTSIDKFLDFYNIGRLSAGYTDVWVIGGAELYKQLIPYAEDAYISFFKQKAKGDTLFPIEELENHFKKILVRKTNKDFKQVYYRNRRL